MKKVVLLVIALMMVASVAFAERITLGDLGELKGTWVGMLSFDIDVNCPVEVVIENDTVLVKVRITVSMVPGQITQQIGGSGGTNVFTSDDGRITTQGTLMFVGDSSKNFAELTYKGNRLDGFFYSNMAKGDFMVKKR